MTIRHTVVFRLAHEAGSVGEQGFLDEGESILSAIPGVEGFTISRQVSPKSDVHWQFSMEFDEQADYDAYNIHPDHVAFVEQRWQVEVEAFQEYDFLPR